MGLPVIPVEGISLRESAAREFSQITDLLRAALVKIVYPADKQNEWLSIEDVYPDRVVIEKDGHYISYPYTIDDKNQVTFGQPVEVVETYVPVAGASSAFVEAVGGVDSGKWLIRVIQSGMSLNGVFYSDAILREAVPLFNGARVFQKSDVEHLKGDGKAFEQLIGGLSQAKFVEGKTADTGEIQATLTLIESQGDVAVKIREADARGLANLFGFSIDASGAAKSQMREGKRVKVATSITKVDSVDLIVEPGAGGRLIRMVEAVNNSGEDAMRELLLKQIKRANPALHAKLAADASDEEIEAAYREAVTAKPATAADNVGLDTVDEKIRMIEARAAARATISGCTLPQAAKDKLLADFGARTTFREADVTAAITGEREYLAKFSEAGRVSMGEFGSGVRMEDRSVVMAGMLDAFFDPKHKDHGSVHSFKECYIEITGDRLVTGLSRNCDMSKLREAAGANFREAVDSSTFANILGDSITRRMQALYVGNTDLQSWRRVASVGRVSDFRTQHVTRMGGYGNLSVVAQGDPYPSLTSPADAETTFAATKRGGTESITLEAIKNDDQRVIMRIPQELALSAGNTLYEFVFDFFRTNPNAWDGTALYHANHGNLFTTALSSAEFAAHRLAMQKQARAGSGKRLGTTPDVLLIPFELQETAYNLFVRNQNLDKTFVQTINPEVIAVPYWTDSNDWVTVSSPDKFSILEVDFMDGNEQPELFVQDNPSVGSMFTNDKLTWKIRHIYGGTLLVDAEKGTTKAVVA